jgi:hypothetical protein
MKLFACPDIGIHQPTTPGSSAYTHTTFFLYFFFIKKITLSLTEAHFCPLFQIDTK